MKRKYHWLAALLAVIVTMAALLGCGGPKAAETKPETAATQSAEETTAPETKAKTAKKTKTAKETAAPETTTAAPAIDEDGSYTSKDEVALYLHTYGKLPSNYITKKEAENLGWKKKDGHAGQLDAVAPGKSIGGSHYGNYEGQLPDKKGRKYFECDIDYKSGNRGAKRIIYSDDGLVYYTGDHYKSFELLYSGE